MKWIILLLSSILIVNDVVPQTLTKNNNQPDDSNFKIIESLSGFKQKSKVAGLAFALFDNHHLIASKCLGRSTYGNEINDETIFSIQSISKNVTALAVMTAVEDGILNLDTPVTEYLPDFRINSCFEDSAEQKITLRTILSHVAGFTHEAPVGNNYDFRPCETREHINSISQTWLKFPVGSNYSYSNLGFDLASAVIAGESGLSFDEYLKLRIFQPVGMLNSTVDDEEVIMNYNRTEGDIFGLKNKHYTIPLPGSGAVYSSLNDMVKYTQLLMNYGATRNDTIIEKKSLFEMFRINTNNYGLGTYIDNSDDILYINHNGGGFGYSASLLWFPEYNLGSVLLCNKPASTFDFCISVMKAYIKSKGLEKNQSVTKIFEELDGRYFKNRTEPDRRQIFTCTNDTVYKQDWENYIGKYIVLLNGMDLKWYARLAQFLGFGYQKFKIKKVDQSLRISGWTGESVLRELEPGLFSSADNEILDFRTDKATYRNIMIRKK
jgi:CubicO group peptidase (beta-lactamase class C family)